MRGIPLWRRYERMCGPDPAADVEDELSFHLDARTDELIAQGWNPDAARREAERQFGDRRAVRRAGQRLGERVAREERCRAFLDACVQDLKFAFRTLRRNAGFTAFAILIIGLGVGASCTVFSVVNALILRPLPIRDAARMVWISTVADDGAGEWRIQVDHFLDLRRQNTSFSDLAGYNAYYGAGDYKLTGDGEPERLSGVPVTQNFFPFLGVQPILGRSFTAEESAGNGPRVALLSNGLWKRRFGSDAGIVGRKLTLNDEPFTVVGVLPASFDFGAMFAPGSRIDLYLPYPLNDQTNRDGNTLGVVGRLNSGATVESARAEFRVLGKRLTSEYPQRNDLRPKLVSLQERVSGRLRPALVMLACAVGVVMLIVCANLSNLLLARTATRQKEMAIRTALGAGRRRLIRQMLTESVALSGGGGALGLVLAVAGTRTVAHLDSFSIPLLETVRVDGYALGFTVVIALLTGLVFGLAPALHAPAANLHASLKDSSRGSSQGKQSKWVRSTLVVSEIAFASVLLVGAGLLIRSFVRVLDVELGFRPDMAAALRVDPGSGYSDQARRNAYYDEVLRRVRTIPGIQAASLADVLPFGGDRSWSVKGRGQVYPRGRFPEAFVRIVSPGYLSALGIPLRAGRDFTERDTLTSEPVVLVNQTLARTLWPGQNPLGQLLDQSYGDNGWRVVGVVSDVRHAALEQESGGEMYLPIRQIDYGYYNKVDLVVRTTLAPTALPSAVRAELRSIDPTLPVNEFRTLRQLVDKAVSPRRFVVILLTGFSAFSLILASLGIYAVISYSVVERTQELGIRIALGASIRRLQARIVLQTLGLAGSGMALGIIASWALVRAIRGLLFGVTSTDPATFIGVAITLASVAALAGYLPARRASRIDPIMALRAD